MCLVVGCGLSAAGTREVDVGAVDASSEGAALPDLDASIDVNDANVAEVFVPADAEADRPDAGVVFVPTHIQPVYDLLAPDVVVSVDTEIDTVARTIKPAGGMAVVSTALIFSPEGATVWSVGALTLDAAIEIKVRGSRPLVIVATRDVTLNGKIDASAGDNAGPGGAAAATGTGKGVDGAKNGNDASGGGGAGHASVGGVGGTRNATTGGAAGPVTNANAKAAALVGGSGGGHGGGFLLDICTDKARGRGGAGGGAVQISSIGKILVSGTGGIDVGGGGGNGGCKDNGGSDAYSGGGGGGAGGTVVLESVTGVELASLSLIAAGGGGGGEGGKNNDNGQDGQNAPYSTSAANGAGNGGAGGTGIGTAALPPMPGIFGDSAGGGGGAAGRLFIGTRGGAPMVAGFVNALRTDYAF